MNFEKNFDKLLEDCSESLPPNYAKFYEEIHSILSSGVAPKSFCIHFAKRLKELNDRMKVFDKQGRKKVEINETELLEFKSVSNKWKLLMGCSEKLPEEIRVTISKLADTELM